MWTSGLLSAICFSLMSLIVSRFGNGFSASEFLLGRSIVGLLVLAPFLTSAKHRIEFSRILLLRGLIGTSAIIILFIMIQNVGAGTATAIHYTSPIFITLLSAFFLKERLTTQKIIALTLVLGGVTLPIFMSIGTLTGPLLLLGLLGAALSGVSFFLLKLMTKNTSEIAIYWMFCLVQLGVQLPISVFSQNKVFQIRYSTIFSSLGYPCLIVGLLACIAQILLNNSFKKLSATTAGLLILLSIPFTVGMEHLYFHQTYDLKQALMISAILFGVLVMRVQTK